MRGEFESGSNWGTLLMLYPNLNPNSEYSSVTMVPEKFDHKVSDQQVLRSGHKLTIGPAGVIPQTVFACPPNGQGDCHVPAFFHHQFRRLEPRLLLQFGQDFSSVDAKELLDLFQT